VGLAALLTAQFFTPAEIIMIDLDANRLEVSKKFGATQTINSSAGNVTEKIMQLTGNKGVDTAIEAVGVPATFELCQSIIAPGGRIANVGVHGKSVQLHLETLWARNITITTRLVDTVTTPMLLKTVASKKLNPSLLITHRFPLPEILRAYDVFAQAGKEKTLKVILINA
jgi:alcohol dehydrogenase